MIDASDVFVGILLDAGLFTKMEYRCERVIRLALGLSKVDRWGAPPWVIQESGYALKAIAAKQKMILFREKGVELPSLQGDLEYIEFDGEGFCTGVPKGQ